MPVVGLLDVGVDAERGELLTVGKELDLCSLLSGAISGRLIFLKKVSVRKMMARFGARPMNRNRAAVDPLIVDVLFKSFGGVGIEDVEVQARCAPRQDPGVAGSSSTAFPNPGCSLR